jgi:hypothetical protein
MIVQSALARASFRRSALERRLTPLFNLSISA